MLVVVLVVSVAGGVERGETRIVVRLPTSPLVMEIRAVKMAGSAYVWRNRDMHSALTPITASPAIVETTITITCFGVWFIWVRA